VRWIFRISYAISSKFHSPRSIWNRELETEVYFWDHWLASKAVSAPGDYARRLDPNCPIAPPVSKYVTSADCKILDVGAGPLTILGKVHNGFRPSIIAVDALADRYEELLAKHGIVPIVKTEALEAERLTERFPAESFDISYAENCLDHCYDPVRAIEQMFTVVKKGGVVILVHSPDVGAKAGYEGLHQWNFRNWHSEFLISSPAYATINISQRYSQRASVVLSTREDGYLIVEMLKGSAR